MYYIFDSNLDVWDCVKELSATDDYSALREFEKELRHMEDKETLELCYDENVLAIVGNAKGLVPELIVYLDTCSTETFCKLKSEGLKFSHFSIA